VITIDPGKHTGWAAWDASPLLAACGVGVPPAFLTIGEHGVIERPMVYPRSPVPPNDIVTLAIDAGRVVGMAGFASVEWVLPRRWKGSAPKAVMHARIFAKLTLAERAIYDRVKDGAAKDCLDAIGLGLWKLGRL